ncbi:MAG: L-2-amino-thiazoline-4-carboxylic acid hydrolase [Clostridiales bacterium]|nr:L-2-amino-thiazoline-4-carboxylic acid hydrolase [Clostridiales bacterium]
MYGEKLFEKTIFSDLKEECIDTFGEKDGQEIFDCSCRICYDLIKNSGVSDRKLKKTVQSVIAPVVSYYKALQQKGLNNAHAYQYTANLLYKRAEEKKAYYSIFLKAKEPYQRICDEIKAYTKKTHNKSGWQIKWNCFDEKGISFDFSTCFYKDMLEKYNCPELCSAFCQMDIIAFAGFQPSVSFERTKTLASGQGVCEFRFIRGD